jgi:hypothetical protein
MTIKKTLISLLVAGLGAVSALAGPRELNERLTDNSRLSHNRKEISTNAKYNLKVDATANRVYQNGAIERTLGFDIDDKTTRVYISDANADGLSKGDFFILEHKFRDGGSLFLNIDYSAEDDYAISGEVDNNYSIQEFHIDTSRLNPVLRLMVKKKIKPIVNFGQAVYSNLVEAVSDNKRPELPYEDVKSALNEFESYLTPTNFPAVRDLQTGLLKLSNRYEDITKNKARAAGTR